MNRIGLITNNSIQTCDGALRTAAIVRTIESLGYAAVTADYTPTGWKKPCTTHTLSGLFYDRIRTRIKKRVTPSAPSLCTNDVRSKEFRDFLLRHANLTEHIDSASGLFALSEKCDAFITACNPICTDDHFDPHYFLDFVSVPEKRIAYGIGTPAKDQKSNPFISNADRLLKEIPHLHVNKESAQNIPGISISSVRTAIDPVLFLTEKDWADMYKDTILPESGYILTYFCNPDSDGWRLAEKYAKENNLSTVTLPVHGTDLMHGDFTRSDAGPSQLIALIKGASQVYTDSAVAAALCIRFEIPFTAFLCPILSNSIEAEYMRTLVSCTDVIAHAKASGVYTFSKPDLPALAAHLESLKKDALDSLDQTLCAACAAERSPHYNITNTCCGCGACESICPAGAISVHSDENGFRTAFVDDTKCIHCGKCRTVCPFFEKKDPELMDMKALYAFKADTETLKYSASGGFSYVLGEHLAAKGYTMLGCVYDTEGRRALHKAAAPDDSDTRKAFRGSKYIQSDMTEALKAINSGLEYGLFVGTPCQVSAVSKLLGSRRKNWVLCELICHGISSDHLWDKYLDHLDREYHTGITPTVLFHPKKYGWKASHHMCVDGNNNHYDRISYEDPFYQTFFSHLAMRNSCFDCPYRRRSAADLRIGDYWGTRYSSDKTGVSMIAVCTDRGMEILHDMMEASNAMCIRWPKSDYQAKQLVNNLSVPIEREDVLNLLRSDEDTMTTLEKKYLRPRYLKKKWQTTYSKLRRRIFRR